MSLDSFLDLFRLELPIDAEQVEREKGMDNPDRRKWVYEHVYLSAGNINALKRNYHGTFAYLAVPEGSRIRRSKRVRISLKATGNYEEDLKEAEDALKWSLHLRGANAGILYKNYPTHGKIIAEAIPAVIEAHNEYDIFRKLRESFEKKQ